MALFIETITTDGSGNTAIRIVGSLILGNKGTPDILNISATSAGTEYNFSLPSDVKAYRFRNRDGGKIKYAFVTGETNTKYYSVMPGNWESDDFVDRDTDLTIYFETTKPNQTIEVLYWT